MIFTPKQKKYHGNERAKFKEITKIPLLQNRIYPHSIIIDDDSKLYDPRSYK